MFHGANVALRQIKGIVSTGFYISLYEIKKHFSKIPILLNSGANNRISIKEVRAIKRLDSNELRKISGILAYRDDQIDTNCQLQEQIKRLADRLSIIKFTDDLPEGEAENSEDKNVEAIQMLEPFSRVQPF